MRKLVCRMGSLLLVCVRAPVVFCIEGHVLTPLYAPIICIGVCGCKKDIREYFSVHHSTRASVCLTVVGNSSVGFHFTDVGSEVFVVSYFNKVIGVAEEFFVELVNISEGGEGVVAHRVNVESIVREYLEERRLLVQFDG
jgi:hypothetical protein